MPAAARYEEQMRARIFTLSFLILAGVIFVWRSHLQLVLLPAGESAISMIPVTSSDAKEGGTSEIALSEQDNSINVSYTLANTIDFPYATLGVLLEDAKHPHTYLDLSAYSILRFSIRCNPKNTLVFSLNTFDEKITNPADFNTLRQAVTSFGCNKEQTDVNIDLRKLEVPEWWLKRNNRELTEKAYYRNQVYSFSIVNSSQSPVETESSYSITNVVLEGRNSFYVYAAWFTLALMLLLSGYWAIGLHKNRLVQDLTKTIRATMPVLAYKEVKLDVKKGRDIKAILDFMGANYANADLSLESLASSLGMNRTKINDLLKAHVGLTFSAYLNKLRLVEAARLLQENADANIAETAYAVGYRNTSWFNTMFKKQYGCTPNAFKKKGRDI